MIKFENVSKIYNGKIEVIKNLNFEIEVGNLILARGESGSGKTTFLRLASGYLVPTSGKLSFDNQLFSEMKSKHRANLYASSVGFAFQDGGLIPYLTVKDNIMLPALALNNKILKRDENRAEELATLFLFEDRLNSLPENLSSGEVKRVALARALFNRPKYLFADEPTGNLDENNALIISKYLCDYSLKGNAVIIASHNKSFIPTDIKGLSVKKIKFSKNK